MIGMNQKPCTTEGCNNTCISHHMKTCQICFCEYCSDCMKEHICRKCCDHKYTEDVVKPKSMNYVSGVVFIECHIRCKNCQNIIGLKQLVYTKDWESPIMPKTKNTSIW